MKPLQTVALALILSAYGTMILGAYVKAIYGGLACPEWPACYDGQVLVPLNSAQVASEILHRAFALLVAFAGVLLLYLVFTRYRSDRRLVALTLAAAGLFAVQVLLGALTIWSLLNEFVVTAHLAAGTAFFGLTLLIAVRAWQVVAASAPEAAKAPEPAEAPEERAASTQP